MSAQQTPGPWVPRYTPGRALGAEDVWCIDWSNDQQEVAEIVHGEANARLIAAAPDLLEALKKLCEDIEEAGATPLDRPAYYKARAAITKATGATE